MKQIKIWTTSNCNLQCTYCYESNNKYRGNFDVNIKPDLMKFLINSQPDCIIFHGGEPLLNFNLIKDIVKTLKENDLIFKAGFTTNGTVWNDDIYKFLQANSEMFRNKISISIDGNKKSMDLTRAKNGGSIYEKVLEVGNKLRLIFPNIRVRMTVIPEEIPNLLDNIKFLYEKGYRYIAVAFEILTSNWSEQDYYNLEDQYEKILNYWLVTNDLALSLAEEICYIRKQGKCSLGCNIYIDGSIYPCTYVVGDSDFCIGNIKNGYIEKKCKELDKINEVTNDNCLCCNYKNYCMYERCKIINKFCTGEYYMPNQVGCTIENIKVKLASKYQKVLLAKADQHL